MLNWSGVVGFDLGAFPKVAAYVKRVGGRPSAIRAMVAEGLIDERQVS